MNLVAAPKADEKKVELGSLKKGNAFRWGYNSFQVALEEEAFFMVSEEKKDNRVTIVNITDGTIQKVDANHRVVKHNVTIQVSE